MKISIIANGFQEHYIYNLLDSLANEDLEIDFLGSDIYSQERINNRIHFINLRGAHDENVSVIKKTRRLISYYMRLAIYLLRSRTKVIHIQWYRFTFLEGIIISLWARICGKKVFYTAHDVLPHGRTHFLNKIIFWFIYRFQHIIIVHTEFIKTRLKREFGIKERKIYVVNHGVYEVMDNTSINVKDARKNYDLNETDFVLLFFGYITSYKGLPLLLEAFQEAKADTDMKLIIAGKVADDYRGEMNKLEEKYNSDDIRMILKFISDEEVDMMFKACNATILPYLEASQSGVLFMSYAYGKPVVAPNLGGFPYDIESGKTGYLFEPGNVLSLKEQLIRLYREWKDKKESDYNYIKKFASKNYSWQASARQLKQIYGSLINH